MLIFSFRKKHYKELKAQLDRIESLLLTQKESEINIMATLADLQAAVTAQTTVKQSVVTLLQGLAAQFKAAIAANNPAAIQAVLDGITANTTDLTQAVVDNTPAATQPAA